MSNPIVKPLKDVKDPELNKLVQFFNETLGFCPNSVLTMQHRPEIARSFIELNKAVMQNKGKVSSALKRLIAYISSYASGCKYCQAHTIRAAERYGAEEEQLENIWEFGTHPAFNESERAALNFALAASSVPNSVDDQISAELRKYWDEGDIVEILGVISLFGYLNRWNDSMGTQLEDEAINSGKKYLKKNGWNEGKHGGSTS